MNSSARTNLTNVFLFSFVTILFIVLVLAAPSLDSGINDALEEDQTPTYTYNFTQNVSGTYTLPLTFSIEGVNSTEHSFPSAADYFWITINSSTGVMTINSTLNNQTGKFNISVRVIDAVPEGQTVRTTFTVNATNDAPNFTNIQNEYNLTKGGNFLDYLNASDEEEQYPLFFNIVFFNNCTHSAQSGRSQGENCSIFNATSFSDTSALMNFTPTFEDVGTYWANISVMDFGDGNDYGCPHSYCNNVTYNVNQTTLYSSVVVFNIFDIFNVNITDCQNKLFQENVAGTCQINITTKYESDSLNISSSAALRHYSQTPYNTSWFFPLNVTSSVNFTKSVNINFAPQKTEIGNWTINFTVQDLTSGEEVTEQIFVYVNRSNALNDVPNLSAISNVETATSALTTISLTVHDDDYFIPDKNENYGGYNETTSFNVTILNRSDLSQELSLQGFDVEILNMPYLSAGILTNRTTARIQFTPNSSEAGNYTIYINVTDKAGTNDTEIFNLTILSSGNPYWSSPLSTTMNLTEGGALSFNLSQNVSDPDGDTLTFSYTNDTTFPSFSLNATTGIVSITGTTDADVGQHLVNITISDGYLTNTTTFNFTIANLNEAPYFEILYSLNSNASVHSESYNVTTTEDNVTSLQLWVQDDDFNIPYWQEGFYNESLNLTTTIQGPNSTLFEFTFDSFRQSPNTNTSKYNAVFNPTKADAGYYNISINISDNSNLSTFISFNLTITEVQHAPSIVELSNYTSSIEESIFINFNATDTEEGTDANGTLRFNITFIQGSDFINSNESIFNTTSGILNVTFNSSWAGQYQLNITVNDTTGRFDSFVWGLKVYDYPKVLSPSSTFTFSMVENTSYSMNFSINHTLQDNLTYTLYVNNVLRNSTSGYGNGQSFIWLFTPNFTDETTCSGAVNLSLNVSNSKLSNFTSWSVNINHTNYPLSYSGTIGGADETITGGTSATVELSSYFTDIDATDSCVNQSIGFVATLLNGSSSIGVAVTNWTNGTSPSVVFTHPSSGALVGNYSLIGYEYTNSSYNSSILRNVSANNFTVELTVSTTVVTTPTQTSGGGGGTTTTPVSLKIIVPDPVTSKRQDRLVLPITIINSGKTTLTNIILKADIAKDGLLREDILASFDTSIIPSLGINAKRNVTAIFDINADEYGLYEITINASVQNPAYTDWAKIFINVEETEGILERIMFTEEFVVGNPECVELKELIDEAQRLFEQDELRAASSKLDEALEACRQAIEQPSIISVKRKLEEYLFNYIWLISMGVFVLGFIYYSYKRRKLRKSLEEVKEKFNNEKRFI